MKVFVHNRQFKLSVNIYMEISVRIDQTIYQSVSALIFQRVNNIGTRETIRSLILNSVLKYINGRISVAVKTKFFVFCIK